MDRVEEETLRQRVNDGKVDETQCEGASIRIQSKDAWPANNWAWANPVDTYDWMDSHVPCGSID